MSDFDFLSGEVSESTTYTPVATGKYRAKIIKGELVDPETLFGPPREDLDEKARAEYLRQFVRFRWQITATADNEPSDYAGRMVDLRVDLRNGADLRTGQSFAKVRADIIRVANGLKAGDEVVGHKLLDLGDISGLDKDEVLKMANEALKKYEGLEAVIAVRAYESKRTGEMKELVGGIVVPKE